MVFSFNTNLSAVEAYNALAKINSLTTGVQLRLATMKKINSVADDTSGYRVGKELEATNTVQKAQLGNAASAKNYLSTAESSLSTINDLLTQISAKYIDAQDPSKNKDSIAKDINALATEIDSILKNTSLNGHNLLANSDGTALSKSDTFNIGGSNFRADFASSSYLNAGALENAIQGSRSVVTPGVPTMSTTSRGFIYKLGGADIIPDFGGKTSSTTAVAYEDGSSHSFTIALTQGKTLLQTFSDFMIAHDAQAMAYFGFGGNIDNGVSISPGGVSSGTGAKITNVFTSSGFDLVSTFGYNYGSQPTGGGGLLDSDPDIVLAAASDISDIRNNVKNALGRIGNLTQTVNIRSDFLTNSITNNTTSISRIFDADMAAEQLNATKGSIGSQIATSMLTQLNSAPQQMLSLFR